MSTPSSNLTEARISEAISRFLGVPSTIPGFSTVLARMQHSSLGMVADLDGATFRTLVMQNGGALLKEEAEKIQREQAQAQRDKDDGLANGAGKVVDAFGNKIIGGALAMAARGDRGGAGGSDGRPNYQTIAYNGSQSLQGVTASNYAGTPFAAAGVNYGTFSYLRGYDRNFTGQDILNAARDVRSLGFDPKNHRAMRNQATIRHYDDKPEETTRALRTFSHLTEEEKKELEKLNKVIKDAKTAEERAAATKARSEFHEKRAEHSGVNGRIKETKHPKAKGAIKDQKELIKQQLNGSPAAPNKTLSDEQRTRTKNEAVSATPYDRAAPSAASAQPSESRKNLLNKLRSSAASAPAPNS
jgi:hypothetical protein